MNDVVKLIEQKFRPTPLRMKDLIYSPSLLRNHGTSVVDVLEHGR